MSQITAFEAPNPALFFKSPRPNDARMGEFVRPIVENDFEKLEHGYVLYGYPDDDGVRANFGRLGAREAPDVIRSAFYKMTPSRRDLPPLYDLGNLRLNGDLRARQNRGAETVSRILRAGHRALALGGGHDYAFADGHAFLNSFESSAGAKSARPLIINFDAHLDVRPDTDGPNSGSAFYQLLSAHKNFDLMEVGLQPHCNSLAHREWTEPFGVTLLDLKDVQGQLLQSVSSTLKLRTSAKSKRAKTTPVKRPTFLSVDIDVFSSAFAPGASASYATGMDANEFLPVLRALTRLLDIRVFGIYEVSPPLDFANKTSQLAAILMHTFLTEISTSTSKKGKK